MNNYPIILSSNEPNNDGSGYKIIEINISDPIENVYAVVTPVQKQ